MKKNKILLLIIVGFIVNLVISYWVLNPKEKTDLKTDFSIQSVDERINYMFGPKRAEHITILFEEGKDSATVVQSFFPETLKGAEICRNCFWDSKFDWNDSFVQNQHIVKKYYTYSEFKKKYPQIAKNKYDE